MFKARRNSLPDIAEQLSAEWSGEDDAEVSKKVQGSSCDESVLIDVAVQVHGLLHMHSGEETSQDVRNMV